MFLWRIEETYPSVIIKYTPNSKSGPWDLPGISHVDYFDSTLDSEQIFGGCGALIFVIDAQVCHNEVTQTVVYHTCAHRSRFLLARVK